MSRQVITACVLGLLVGAPVARKLCAAVEWPWCFWIVCCECAALLVLFTAFALVWEIAYEIDCAITRTIARFRSHAYHRRARRERRERIAEQCRAHGGKP